MKKIIAVASLVILSMVTAAPLSAANDPIVSKKVEGDFHDIANSIRTAITGKGISIAHVLHASDMLRRTASAFGYANDVYQDAEIYEFCSAKISQQLARISPDNIVMCPFTIGIYSLTAELGTVNLVYRIPTGKPGTEEVIKEVVELIEGIIEDASW